MAHATTTTTATARRTAWTRGRVHTSAPSGCSPANTPPRETTMADSCVFCEIVAGRAPAKFVRQWADTIAIVPLNPVTDGHVLVIPKNHVRDASESPHVAGLTMARAAEIAKPPFNIITSAGRAATQSDLHLHLHSVTPLDVYGMRTEDEPSG